MTTVIRCVFAGPVFMRQDLPKRRNGYHGSRLDEVARRVYDTRHIEPGALFGPEGMTIEEAAEHVPFLRAISPPDRERLKPHALVRRLERGESLWRQGDPTGSFAFVVRGRVKLVKSSEAGREVILELCGPGQLLCASAVCSFAPYCCAAAAMEDDVEVVVLPRREVQGLLESCPAAAQAFLREVTGRGMSLCQRVEELSSGLVERRIATLLLRLADQVGRPRSEGIWIPIPLSRQDLADLCGTTIETAIRVMTRFGREGLVGSAARGLVVMNRAALEALARGTRGD